jgi:hypothetical protein
MTTATTPATLIIETIEAITNDQVLFICNDEAAAKECLMRNPRASIQRGADDDKRVALVYNIEDVNMINAIKRG